MWDGWERKFGCIRTELATLRGFRRDFNKASVERWGSDDIPGPTLGLTPAAEAECVGSAFEFADTERNRVVGALRRREGPSFKLGQKQIELSSGPRVRAVVPINDQSGSTFIGDRSLEDRARLAKAARGTKGSCVDYVIGIREKLRELGVNDPGVEEFSRLVSEQPRPVVPKAPVESSGAADSADATSKAVMRTTRTGDVAAKERVARVRRGITEVLQALPLLEDDLYLRMQAFNLGVVDQLLNEMEEGLFADYIDQEHTPMATFIPVAAISQLWVFGVYELLRTWRQRVTDVLGFADEVAALPSAQRKLRIAEQIARITAAASDPDHADPVHAKVYVRAARNKRSRERLRAALDRSEWPFRRLEALRVYLAKHEVPRSKGSFGSAPGVGGVDSIDGSVLWFVDLGGKQVDSLSRKKVAEMCRELGSRRPLHLLPRAIQQRIKKFPRHSYGIKRVMLRLSDGSQHAAYIAWDKQVAWLPGGEGVPFDVSQVVDAEPIPPDAP